MTDSNDSVPTQALSRRSLRTPEPKAPGRISAIIRKHPTAWLISAIAVVGAIVVAAPEQSPPWITALGLIAVVASTVNIVSGFLITDRMLKMFKKKEGQKS